MVGYLLLMLADPDVRRLFQYHGAEPQDIKRLRVGGAIDGRRGCAPTRLHPRCGTGFLVVVVVVSIVVFTFVGRPALPLLIPLAAATVPVIAAIA